jgi:hypothetical protein
MSSAEQYKDLIGSTFRLRGDCFIYCFEDERARLRIMDKNLFPGNLSSDYVGKVLNYRIILGCLKKGTEFRLDSVWRQEVISDARSERWYFMISLKGAEQARWTKLDAVDLTEDYRPKWPPSLPMFLPRYVELVDQKDIGK